MPNPVILSPPPELKFGVFNRYGREVEPHDGDYARQQTTVGWRIIPHYMPATPRTHETREEAAELLSDNIRRWRSRRDREKREALTISDVLVDRFIQRVLVGGWGPTFYFMDGTDVKLERTRGYYTPTMEGPTEGPFLIRRVLADQRTFRLENGHTLRSSTKLQLRPDTIPQWIIDQFFPD